MSESRTFLFRMIVVTAFVLLGGRSFADAASADGARKEGQLDVMITSSAGEKGLGELTAVERYRWFSLGLAPRAGVGEGAHAALPDWIAHEPFLPASALFSFTGLAVGRPQ